MMGESRETTSLLTPGSISSSDEGLEDRILPSSLAREELLLAINKEATQEELQQAIARCKELVLDCDHCTIERKWLVRHLIELRLRLQECKEALKDPNHPRNKAKSASRRSVKGHHFKLQPFLTKTTSTYCDQCTGMIWSLLQTWYECEDCGYNCHYNCLGSVLRECAHVVASEKGTYEFDICPESGLSAQKYKCAECKAPLILNKEWSEAKKCDYNGLYYCSACHWGSSAVIPARVVHNWDFTSYPVCQASLQLLRISAHRPLIKIESLHPKLFTLVHELSLVQRLRQTLQGIRKYLLVCRFARDDHLLMKFVDVPHLLDTPDLVSLQDLVETHSGELPAKLLHLLDVFSKHIKESCEICKGRGHICEICSNNEVLFPFDKLAFTCNECQAVYHEKCFNIKNECPRCDRIRNRAILGDMVDGAVEALEQDDL